jgi:putative oxidoreductase
MKAVNRLFEYISAWIVQLLARVVVGLVFFKSGLTKIDGFSIAPSTFVLFENEYQVPLIPPDIAAYMATAAELTMPLLLWVGLFSRLAATPLLIMTIVIEIFVYPLAYETHGLWATALLLIMIWGPGKVSLDYLLGFEPPRDSKPAS